MGNFLISYRLAPPFNLASPPRDAVLRFGLVSQGKMSHHLKMDFGYFIGLHIFQ